MTRGLVLALLLIEGVAGADDRPDPLAQARTAVAESDYVGARPALVAALEAGGRGPEDLVEIYRLTGIVSAALGDAKAATAAFTRLLALSPKAALPAGTSPKITRPFDAAVRFFTGHAPLELKLETLARPPTITLVVASDPLHLVARARVTFVIDGGAERSKDVVASDRTAIALPAGKRIDARVAALDDHGNRLFEIGSKDVPIVIIGEAPVIAPNVSPVAPVARAPDHPTGRSPDGTPGRSTDLAGGRPLDAPLYRRWWPYAAVAVGFGGAAAYFGWSARSAAHDLDRLNASPSHSSAEAKTLEDRARRNVLLTNVGLVGAGAFAITAGVMFILTPRDHAETRVTAVPVPGGGAVVLGGKF